MERRPPVGTAGRRPAGDAPPSALVIEPVERSPSLAEVLSGLVPSDEDFGPIEDPLTEPEEVF